MNIQKYKGFIALHEQKKEAEEALEDIKEAIAAQELLLIDELIDNEMTKITIDGRTVYINSTIWASVSNKDKAIEVLQSEGYGDYIKPSYNTQQVSRLLRDFEENEQDIPLSFKGIIDPFTKQSLKVIKG